MRLSGAWDYQPGGWGSFKRTRPGRLLIFDTSRGQRWLSVGRRCHPHGCLCCETQLVERAAFLEQLLVGTGLHDLAAIEHQDAITVEQRGEPMCDQDHRANFAGNSQRLLHPAFTDGVQG